MTAESCYDIIHKCLLKREKGNDKDGKQGILELGSGGGKGRSRDGVGGWAGEVL